MTAGCVTASRTFGSAPCLSSSAALGSSRLLMASIRSAAGAWPESGGPRPQDHESRQEQAGPSRAVHVDASLDSTNLEDEIELRRKTVRHLSRRHDQRWPDVGIVMIPRIALEIQLRRQDRRVLDACLHVNVRGAHVIGCAVVKRLDGAQRVATIVAACRAALAAGNRCCRRPRCDRPARCRAMLPSVGRPLVSRTRPVTVSGVPAMPGSSSPERTGAPGL